MFVYGVFANNCLFPREYCIQYLRTIKQLGSMCMKELCLDIRNTMVMMSDRIHFHFNGVVNKHNC